MNRHQRRAAGARGLAPTVDSQAMLQATGRRSGTAHQIVLETAQAMAHELYDTLMQNNEWYKLWKSWHPEGTTSADLEASFVRRNTPGLLPGARSVLAQMLPTVTDPALRETIFDALLLDATLTAPERRGTRGMN